MRCRVWLTGEGLTCLCQLEIQRCWPDYHVALGVYEHTVSWSCIHSSKFAHDRHRVLHIGLARDHVTQPFDCIDLCLPTFACQLTAACSFACQGQKFKLCFARAVSADVAAYPVVDHMPGVRDFCFVLFGKSPVARPGGAHSVHLQREPGEKVSNVIGCQHSHHSPQRMPCMLSKQSLR